MFGYPGFWQLLIVLLLVVLLFGRGKISDLMGDVAKGITSFKKGLKDGEEDQSADASARSIENEAGAEAGVNMQKEKADLS